VDSNDTLQIGAAASQTKRKKTLEREQEQKEKKKLRSNVSTAMDVFVKSATEDSLTAKRLAIVDLEERMVENEVKELSAPNERVRLCYANLIAKQRVHLEELQREVQELKEQKKAELVSEENDDNNYSGDSDGTSKRGEEEEEEEEEEEDDQED
jgi:hypothetical protein